MRFPKIHVAQSTVNRILNTAAGIESTIVDPLVPPPLPNTSKQSLELDAAMKEAPAPTGMPAGAGASMVDASLKGDSPLDAAVTSSLQGSELP